MRATGKSHKSHKSNRSKMTEVIPEIEVNDSELEFD